MTTQTDMQQPVQARRVMVPLANPNTAPGLIGLAWKLADVQDGRVLALYVMLSSAELDSRIYEDVERIVAESAEKGIPIELLTVTAPSIARGILDAAREYGATLMVLGFQTPVQGRIKLGPIVEAVARTTPCDLVVFRNVSHSHLTLEDVQRVILPLDGGDNSRVAARLGLTLAKAYDAEPVAMYMQTDPDLPGWFGLARIEASLSGLPPEDTRLINRQVIRAQDVVSGIITRVDEQDMVVLGFSERSSLDRWIFGNVAQRMLAQAPGPVILAKRAISQRLSRPEEIGRRLLIRLSPKLTPSEKTEVVRSAQELSLPGINFLVLMFLSALLASFGLMQSSAAVIIGAMLVAPLMSPLMAFSVGLIQGNPSLMRRSAMTVIIGSGVGLVVAALIGVILPLDLPTSEMLSRGRPSLLDMGVALASGMAGAYAIARKDIPSALAGVAIAAALVPPLCTVGLALAFAEMTLAAGAALLFATNIVSISLAGAGVFVWLGLRPGRQESRARRHWIISLTVLVVLSVPLASSFIDVVQRGRQTSAAVDVLQDTFDEAEVIEVELERGDPLTVVATVSSRWWITTQDAREAEDALERRLGRDVVLEITNWRQVSPP